jgi:hypothetical protein
MSNAGQAFHQFRDRESLREYGHLARQDEAQLGSAQLRDRIIDAFERFEIRHGLNEGEGRFLLLETGIRHQRGR